jgi:hypothetical protein
VAAFLARTSPNKTAIHFLKTKLREEKREKRKRRKGRERRKGEEAPANIPP